MAKFDNVIEELDYQLRCHIAADVFGYESGKSIAENNALINEWNEAIRILKEAGNANDG